MLYFIKHDGFQLRGFDKEWFRSNSYTVAIEEWTMKKKSTTHNLHPLDEKTLQDKARQLQQIIDEMASGFALHEIICDKRGIPVDYRFLEINAAFERLTGLVAADVVGKRALEVLPDTEPFWIETFGRVALKGQPERFENFSKALDKTFSVVAFCPEPGQFAVLFEDISERKQAEEKLQTSEARYHTLVETAQDLIWQCDAEGRYTYLNPAWEEVFGYPLQEMLGKKFVEFQTAEYAEKDLQEFKRLLTGDIVKGLETVHLGKDGREIHLVFNAKQLVDAEGKPAGTQGTAYDITKRKQTEQALLESERRFRETLENVNLIAIELDETGIVTFCNDHFLQLTGWQREEIIGRNWFETCLPARTSASVREILITALGSGTISEHFENEIITRQGEERLISWNNTALRDALGRLSGVSSIGEDITEKRRAEDKIHQSEAELKKAQAYAHVGSWVWNIKEGTLKWSDEMYAIFGISKENFSGNLEEVVASAIHPDDREKVERSNSMVAIEGNPIPLEYRILRPDGSQRVVWAEAGELELDSEGKPALLRGFVMDITERKRAEDELEKRAEELELLQKTVLDITTTQNLPGLLKAIVERACQLAGATAGGSMYMYNQEKQESYCAISYKTPANYVGNTIQTGEGAAGKVIQTGQPLNVKNYRTWPGRSPMYEKEKIFSGVLCVPLLWGGEVNGVLSVYHFEDGKFFSTADQDLLGLFAGHAAIAIENSRLLEASLAGESEVRKLSTRLAEAEENERRRIARELHDQVGQSLSALSINMNIMHSQIPEYLPGFKRRLDDSLMLIDQTTDHIRNLMSELRPAVLDDYGLKAALDWAAGSIARRTSLKLLVEGECNRFPPRVEIALFRIAQEALGNIARHARARNVKILLTQSGAEMSMAITDDGVGFDPAAVAATDKSGWGLRLMAERAESIGGSLQVESSPGQGTSITVRVHDQDFAGG
jgi:PAS domain S-box-containing protein